MSDFAITKFGLISQHEDLERLRRHLPSHWVLVDLNAAMDRAAGRCTHRGDRYTGGVPERVLCGICGVELDRTDERVLRAVEGRPDVNPLLREPAGGR